MESLGYKLNMRPNLASSKNHNYEDYHENTHDLDDYDFYNYCGHQHNSSYQKRENDVIIKSCSVVSTTMDDDECIRARLRGCNTQDQRSQRAVSTKSLGPLVSCALIVGLVLLHSTIEVTSQVPSPPNNPKTAKNLEYNNTNTSSITTSESTDRIATLKSSTTTLASISLNENNEISNTNLNNSSEDSSKLLKNVNFTQVDDIFNAVLSESELVSKWRSMDTQIQESVKGILKMIFPQILAISQDAKVRGECSGAILKWILSLRNLRSWAIRMLDASGKPTSGIFQGSLSMLGNYKQCLAVRAPDEDEIEITDQFEEYFRGRYCVLQMRPWLPTMPAYYNLNATIEPLLRKSYKYYEKTLYDDLAEIASAFNFVNIRMDLCIPSSCNAADIQRVADLLGRKMEMRTKVMRCDTESRDPWWARVDSTSAMWALVTCVLIAVPLVATLINCLIKILLNGDITADDTSFVGRRLRCLSLGDILRERLSTNSGDKRWASKQSDNCESNQVNNSTSGHSNDLNTNDKTNSEVSPNPSVPESSLEIATTEPVKDTKLQTINYFLKETETTPTTQSKLEDNDDNQHQIKSHKLHLVRTIMIIWFIVVQLSADLNYQYLRESLLLRDLLFTYWPFQLIINSTLLFESFILLTAFSYAYTCFGCSAYKILGYFVQKYLRVTLPMVAIISFTIMLPLVNIESPIWRNLVDQQASLCKTNGFIDLLMLQNFIPFDKMCLPHTWVLCVEFQLALLSIPLLLLIGKTMKERSNRMDDQFKLSTNSTREAKTTPQSSCYIQLLFVKSIGTLIGIQLIAFGFIMNFLIVFTNNMPPAWFSTFPEPKDKDFYFSFYLTKPWTHLSTFMIGLLAGCLARCLVDEKNIKFKKLERDRQQQIRLNPFIATQSSPVPSCASPGERFSQRTQSNSTLNASQNGSTMILIMTNASQHQGQEDGASNVCAPDKVARCNDKRTNRTSFLESSDSVICTSLPVVIMLAIIYSTFRWSTQELPSNIVAALYDSVSRISWSGSLGFMLIRWTTSSCGNTRDNQKVTTFESSCIFLGRLSLLAFLISPLINNFLLAVQEQAIFSSIFIIFHLIVGNTLIIYVVSFFVAILIEQPLTRLVADLKNFM